jgi:hypothetical protein
MMMMMMMMMDVRMVDIADHRNKNQSSNIVDSFLNELRLINLKPKLFINNFFNDLISQVDLDAETVLWHLSNSNKQNQDLDDDYEDED